MRCPRLMRFSAVEGMAHFCWTSTFINIERFKEKISTKISAGSSNLEDRKEFARKVKFSKKLLYSNEDLFIFN
jgi:hypothetical protein